MNQVLDVIALCLFTIGALTFVITAIGLVRVRTLLDRNHVASLPALFSLVCFLLGAALMMRSWGAAGVLLLVALVQVLTSPIGNHFLARSAVRVGFVPASDLEVDELSDVLEGADDEDDHVDVAELVPDEPEDGVR